MSEMNTPENKQPQNLESYLAERSVWLQAASEVMNGDSHTDPIEVFPAPTAVREDAEPVELSAEDEQRLRAAAAEFGMGAAEDTVSAASHHIIEGGLAWKIAAEAKISTPTDTFLFAGSPTRKITDKEEEFMTKLISPTIEEGTFWSVGETEYDIARQIAETQPGFTPLDEDVVLPFGYEVKPGGGLIQEATGQFIQIGENEGRAVVLMRVDQDNPEPPYYRPDTAALMGIVADVLTNTGDENSSVGVITTNTYPSREIDAMRAGISRQNRRFDVGMVGRETMAEVKNEEVAPTPLNQIPGELHQIAKKLGELQQAFENQ